MSINVLPILEALGTAGIKAKEWLVKAAKSKTVLFSTLLTVLGTVEIYMPFLKGVIGDPGYGVILATIGVLTGMLRFATTQAISDK